MKGFLSASVVAAVLTSAAVLGGTPAQASNFTIGVGPSGINFSVSSGGYCDDRGCPDAFWDMPVYYCPVFYKGDWFRGPVYYRRGPGGMEFWIRGKWHRDSWRGPRPGWACTDRLGPALGFEYYERHGFRMRDEWRDRWHRDHRPDIVHPDRDHHGPDFSRPDKDRHGPDFDRHDDRHSPDRNAMHGPDHKNAASDRRDDKAGRPGPDKAQAKPDGRNDRGDKPNDAKAHDGDKPQR